MQTNPAAEQNRNIEWSESPWNQCISPVGMEMSMEGRICRKAKS